MSKPGKMHEWESRKPHFENLRRIDGWEERRGIVSGIKKGCRDLEEAGRRVS